MCMYVCLCVWWEQEVSLDLVPQISADENDGDTSSEQSSSVGGVAGG